MRLGLGAPKIIINFLESVGNVLKRMLGMDHVDIKWKTGPILKQMITICDNGLHIVLFFNRRVDSSAVLVRVKFLWRWSIYLTVKTLSTKCFFVATDFGFKAWRCCLRGTCSLWLKFFIWWTINLKFYSFM